GGETRAGGWVSSTANAAIAMTAMHAAMLERTMRIRLSRAVFISALILALDGAALSQPAFKGEKFPEDAFALPEPALPERKPLRLWATWYHIYAAKEVPGGVPLLDPKGEPISRPIAESAFCHGAIAGTMRITDLSGRARTYKFVGLGEDAHTDCGKYL